MPGKNSRGAAHIWCPPTLFVFYTHHHTDPQSGSGLEAEMVSPTIDACIIFTKALSAILPPLPAEGDMGSFDSAASGCP